MLRGLYLCVRIGLLRLDTLMYLHEGQVDKHAEHHEDDLQDDGTEVTSGRKEATQEYRRGPGHHHDAGIDETHGGCEVGDDHEEVGYEHEGNHKGQVVHDGVTVDDGLVDVEDARADGERRDGLACLALREEERGDEQAERATGATDEAEGVDNLHVHVVVGLDCREAAGSVGAHVLGDQDGEHGLGKDAGDGALVNTQAEEQIGEGVDDNDTPDVGVKCLQRGLYDQLDDISEVGAKANIEHGGEQTERSEGEQHRDHDVEGAGYRRRHALAKVNLELVDARELDEERRREQADDDGAKQAVRTGVGRQEYARDHAGDVVDHDLDALGHRDEEGGDGNDHTGNVALIAHVMRMAVTNDTSEEDGRDVERTERERVSPVLCVRECLVSKEQREQNVVDEYRYTCQDVERHDGGKGVAQAA